MTRTPAPGIVGQRVIKTDPVNEVPMPDAGAEALDQMIREAVAGMRIGLV